MEDKVISTIEEISIPKTIGNLWSEMEDAVSISKKLINFSSNSEYHLRLIGNFVKTQRFFIPKTCNLSDNISVKELKSIIAGDEEDIENICERILSFASEKTKRALTSTKLNLVDRNFTQKEAKEYKFNKEILSVVRRLGDNKIGHWQSCILSNAYIKNVNKDKRNELGVIAMVNSMCLDLINKNESKKKISGIFAHDLTIKKFAENPSGNSLGNSSRGFASRNGNTAFNKTKYDVKIAKCETYLSNKEIGYLLKNGIIDLKIMVKELNKDFLESMSGYVYKYSKGMIDIENPTISSVYKEIKDYEFNSQFLSANENLNELPSNAFEDLNYNDSLSSLEV